MCKGFCKGVRILYAVVSIKRILRKFELLGSRSLRTCMETVYMCA